MAHMRLTSLLAVSAFSCIGSPPALAATVIDHTDFSSTSGLTTVGSTGTASTADGTVLRIVPASTYTAGAAYSTTPVTLGNNATFSTQFQFRFTQPGGIDPADGITFVLAASPTGLGSSGAGLGYQGVPNSAAIEFDTFDNGEIGSNHVAFDAGGALTNSFANSPYGVATCNFSGATPYSTPGCMTNGDLWTATITYDGSFLNVSVSDPAEGSTFAAITNAAVDLYSILGTNTAYVGFTGGTGAGWQNEDIKSWTFANTATLPVVPSVPEPATWGMMVLGIGALGLAMRRQRNARTTVSFV